MLLISIALFGLLVPNGLFVYYMLIEFDGWQSLLNNTLALAFVIDAFMATALAAWFFAVKPVGPVKWPWFVILSLLGGLGFSLPFYYWLNRQRSVV